MGSQSKSLMRDINFEW